MNATENQNPNASGEYMDTKEGSTYIRISPRHFARLRARGMIPAVRLSPHCVRFRGAAVHYISRHPILCQLVCIQVSDLHLAAILCIRGHRSQFLNTLRSRRHLLL